MFKRLAIQFKVIVVGMNPFEGESVWKHARMQASERRVVAWELTRDGARRAACGESDRRRAWEWTFARRCRCMEAHRGVAVERIVGQGTKREPIIL